MPCMLGRPLPTPPAERLAERQSLSAWRALGGDAPKTLFVYWGGREGADEEGSGSGDECEKRVGDFV